MCLANCHRNINTRDFPIVFDSDTHIYIYRRTRTISEFGAKSQNCLPKTRVKMSRAPRAHQLYTPQKIQKITLQHAQVHTINSSTMFDPPTLPPPNHASTALLGPARPWELLVRSDLEDARHRPGPARERGSLSPRGSGLGQVRKVGCADREAIVGRSVQTPA